MEGSYSELAEQLQGSHVRVAKFQADVDREFAQERFGLKTFPTIVMLPKAGNQVSVRRHCVISSKLCSQAVHCVEATIDCTRDAVSERGLPIFFPMSCFAGGAVPERAP